MIKISNLIKSLVICLSFSVTSLFAAGPLLHLWVAERFCLSQGISDPHVIREIMVGSEFPDIRYISHLSRELTHPIVCDIKEINQSGSAFEKGMKLHAWFDVMRENLVSPEVYDEVALYAEGHSATLLKFIEEEMLADFYESSRWSEYFDEVLPGERLFIEEGVINKWHYMVQWTLSVRPSWLLWAQSYRGQAFGVSADTLYRWSYLLPELKQKEIFVNHLHKLLASVEAELKVF